MVLATNRWLNNCSHVATTGVMSHVVSCDMSCYMYACMWLFEFTINRCVPSEVTCCQISKNIASCARKYHLKGIVSTAECKIYDQYHTALLLKASWRLWVSNNHTTWNTDRPPCVRHQRQRSKREAIPKILGWMDEICHTPENHASSDEGSQWPVSYTHLTLPTIYSV